MKTTAGSSAKATTLRRALNLPALVVFGLTYLAPVVVFTTYGIGTSITGGHLAAAYLVAVVVMIFTALSYGHLSREFPNAGSAYSYVRHAFGAVPGFLAGWILLLDYLLLPMLNYLVIGIMVNAQFPNVPRWALVLSAVAVVFITSVLGITAVSRVSLAILLASIGLVVLFVVLALRHLAHSGTTTALLEPVAVGGSLSAVMAGAAILTMSFLGFDAVSTMSEEAKRPRVDVPRAILLTTLIAGALFMAVAWIAQLLFPDWTAFSSLDAASSELMELVGGQFMVSVFTAIYVVGAIGSAIVTQTSVSRILYAMARDGVLPKPLAYLHPRFQTPVGAIAVVAALGLIALVSTLTLGSSMVSFGALTVFAVVNLAVVKIFVIDQRRRSARSLLTYGALPLTGFALTIWLWRSLDANALIVGGVWTLLGVVLIAFKTRGFRSRTVELDFSENVTAPSKGACGPVSAARPERGTTSSAVG